MARVECGHCYCYCCLVEYVEEMTKGKFTNSEKFLLKRIECKVPSCKAKLGSEVVALAEQIKRQKPDAREFHLKEDAQMAKKQSQQAKETVEFELLC